MPKNQTENAEKDAGITDAQIEWREQIGQRLMLAMTCQHGSDYFGTGAVCETCFANVQRIGHLIERIAAQAWDEGYLHAIEPESDVRDNSYRVLPPASTDPTPAADGLPGREVGP